MIRNIRTGIAALLKCHTILKVVRLTSYNKRHLRVTDFPIAFGMHLFARRTQMGLSDLEAAADLGVTPKTYHRWEVNDASPELARIPSVIRFLGYSPYDPSLPLREKLVLWRSLNGISQQRFASMMKVDQSTLAKWERGDCRPYPILRPRIFAARASLGNVGHQLFVDGNHKVETRHAIPETGDTSRIRRLTVGTLTIQFPPSMFVFYESGWTIGQKLEAWRTSLGLSQRDFAKLTGFAPQSICRWEKGRRDPSPEHVTHLRTILSKTLSYIE